MTTNAMDRGIQPLDSLMTRLALSNADLINASTEMLNFKMVQKGRKGRYLTLNIRHKILNALRSARPDGNFTLEDLFNY